MKLLVLSDSHGNEAFLERILRRERACDLIVHLGDGADDMTHMNEFTVGKAVLLTKGNCDYSGWGFEEKHVFKAEGKTVLACHGHRMNVKTGLDGLYFAGLKENADLCLFGHTHRQQYETGNGMVFLNPGAVYNGFYATVEITADGRIVPTLKSL